MNKDDNAKDRDPRPDMSRRDQTLVILLVLFVFGVLGYNYMLKHDRNDPYAPCASIVGYDQSCKAAIAAERLSRGY
jgi:hypothetical protein